MLVFLGKVMLSGSAVSVGTTLVLAALARAEGKTSVQPVNSTSHWYLGEAAGRSRAVDLRHTLLGFATHYGASLFWAGIFEAARRYRPQRPAALDAAAVSALAAVVDYAVVPKRLTPGWEKVVTPRAIGITYGVMAMALAASALLRPATSASDDRNVSRDKATSA